MNLVEEKQRGLIPSGLQSWQLQLIEHFTNTTNAAPPPSKTSETPESNQKGGGLLALLYIMFSSVFVAFSYGVLGRVWCLIVSIPDICHLPCFSCVRCFLVLLSLSLTIWCPGSGMVIDCIDS